MDWLDLERFSIWLSFDADAAYVLLVDIILIWLIWIKRAEVQTLLYITPHFLNRVIRPRKGQSVSRRQLWVFRRQMRVGVFDLKRNNVLINALRSCLEQSFELVIIIKFEDKHQGTLQATNMNTDKHMDDAAKA